ncbi:MAG: translation initiation factor IF-3, partial [Pseudomonadales bacterium]
MKRDSSKSKKAQINDDILSDPVRLVLADGTQQGIVPLDEAKGLAEGDKLDLVLISPEADPPVCKIMDYGKHIFELKKQNAANKK